jgi:hypothetical protein
MVDATRRESFALCERHAIDDAMMIVGEEQRSVARDGEPRGAAALGKASSVAPQKARYKWFDGGTPSRKRTRTTS